MHGQQNVIYIYIYIYIRNEKQMRHKVKRNVSETGFGNGGWLGPQKITPGKKKEGVIYMTIQNNAYWSQYIPHAPRLRGHYCI